MNHSQTHSYDVVIAGAGPVGLFLACELALAKCTVLMLEKLEKTQTAMKKIPFGIRGLSTPSIEALYRRGLLEEFEIHKRLKNPHMLATAKPGEPVKRPMGHFAGIPFFDVNIDDSKWPHRLPGSTEPSMMTEMAEIETILSRRAKALGVEIRHGIEVTAFHQTENDVTVQSDDQSFQCSWLVGCDGSRSVVRKLGGIEFAGTEPEFTGYSVQADIVDPEKLKPGRNVTPRGMYLQSQPGYLNLQDFDGGVFHNKQEATTRDHVQEVLRRISGTDVTISALHIATTWTDRARQATAYRKGRILLAGDAAHIHAPLGGQGLNLGLGDAMNVGWKLAATIHHKAPAGMLDSYFTERHPIGVQVLDWSRAQVAIMEPKPPAQALHAILRDLMDTRDGATYFAGRVWGVNIHYHLEGNHPLTGYSVPDFEFEDGTKLGGLMRDGKGILLDFGSNKSLESLANEYANSVQYVSRQVKNAAGLHALLIRPDGYIAWATEHDANESSLRLAMDSWFTR